MTAARLQYLSDLLGLGLTIPADPALFIEMSDHDIALVRLLLIASL